MRTIFAATLLAGLIASGPAISAGTGQPAGITDSNVNPFDYSEVLPLVYAQNPPDLTGIGEDANIEIVGLSELTGTTQTSGADLTIAIGERDPSALREEIKSSKALMAALEEENVKLEDILAVARHEEDGFIIYVDDRATS